MPAQPTPSSQLRPGVTVAVALLFALILLLGGSGNGGPALAQSPGTTTVVYPSTSDIFANPERGFYKHEETHSTTYVLLDQATLESYRQNENITLILRIFYLDEFVNQPISSGYLISMTADFNTMRQAGLKAVVRFAYTNQLHFAPDTTWPPIPPYGDATKAQMLAHLAQLAPVLQANSDVIALIQTGFIGIWGEWYYTDYFVDDPANPSAVSDPMYAERGEILSALLAAAPDEMAQLRTPLFKQKLFGTGTGASEALPPANAFDGSDRARTGHHNDCFLASSTDFGTYDWANLAADRDFLAEETKYLPMGGETCNDTTDDDNPDTPGVDESSDRSLCPNALAELEQFHWSYLNADYHPGVLNKWENGFTYNGTPYAACMDEVKRRLGYRLALVDGTFPNQAQSGQSIEVELTIRNDGWAAPFNPRPVELILRHQATGQLQRTPLPVDPRLWLADGSGTHSVQESIPLDTNLPPGVYDLLLNLPDPDASLASNPAYSIRLANGGTWESDTGFNALLHSITVAGPITFDATALSAQEFNIDYGTHGGGSNVTTTLPLAPGSYNFFAPGSDVSFPFSVSPSGTVEYDTSLDAFLSGRGTSQLTVAGFPITFDATQLTTKGYNINYNAAGGSTSSNYGIERLIPGNYGFFSPGSEVSFPFSISPGGTVEYDTSLDAFVSGRGTSQLTVTGFPITFDATGLTTEGYNINYGTAGGTSSSNAGVERLLPGDYRFFSPGSHVFVPFTVNGDGTLDYPTSLDSFIDGRGTNIFTANGVSMTVDARALSSLTFNVNYNTAGKGFNAHTTPLYLLPGDYTILAPASHAPTAVNFSLAADGTIDYDSSVDSYVGGRGTNTLLLNGLPLTIDATQLTPPRFNINWNEGGQGSTAVPAQLRLMPGDYSYLAPASEVRLDFSLGTDGTLDYPTSADAYVSGRGTPSMTISGFPITIDGTPLDAVNYNIGFDSGGRGNNDAPTLLRFLPGSYDYFAPRSAAAGKFRFVVENDGLVTLDPSLSGYVAGSGTTALTVNGRTISVDASALPGSTFRIESLNLQIAGQGYLTETTDIALLPGAYTIVNRPASGSRARFNVAADGSISFDASLNGYLSASGSALTVLGLRLDDVDSDGVTDYLDNCPTTPNPGQENFEGDAYGDACDWDQENDDWWDNVDYMYDPFTQMLTDTRHITSSHFSDVQNGGVSYGQLLSMGPGLRGGGRDLNEPDGIVLYVRGEPTSEAVYLLCGVLVTMSPLPDGREAVHIFRCGSLTSTVQRGSITVHLDGGVQVEVGATDVPGADNRSTAHIVENSGQVQVENRSTDPRSGVKVRLGSNGGVAVLQATTSTVDDLGGGQFRVTNSTGQGKKAIVVEAQTSLTPLRPGSAQTVQVNRQPQVGPVQIAPAAPAIGQPVTANAAFSDPDGGDSHTCTVDYGDGSGPQPGQIATGVCQGPTYSYSAAGDYAVRVTVNDQSGGVASASATVSVSDEPPACDLYPIALYSATVANAQPGQLLADILNGSGSGNFGWLRWDGDNSTPALVAALTPPGTSASYANPNDPADHFVTVGDWVRGRTGVSNAKQVRNALDSLIAGSAVLTLPVWDVSQGQGGNSQYRVSGFAQVRLRSYRLPGQNRISAEYVGAAVCGAGARSGQRPQAMPEPEETGEVEEEVRSLFLPAVQR